MALVVAGSNACFSARMRNIKRVLFIFAFCRFFLFASSDTQAFVDLHSHAFMKQGMGALFHGDFHGHVEARSWRSMLASKITADSLNQSPLKLLVVALYAHPILVMKPGRSWDEGVKHSLLLQIKQAKKFVAENPDWVLASRASDAWQAFKQKKRIMVLSLEGAHGITNDDQEKIKFLKENGIALITPIHLINNDYGGAAYMKGLRKSLFTWKNIYFKKKNGKKFNPVGLSDRGKKFIEGLALAGIWVDMSHMSEEAVFETLPILNKYRQPLLWTHMSLRKYYGDERALSDEMIDMLGLFGGIVGLVPSEEMVVKTKVDDAFCPVECRPCQGGTEALAQHYFELTQVLRPGQVMLGGDFSGGIPHLAPSACKLHNSLDKNGLVSVDQLGDLWEGIGLRLKSRSPIFNQNSWQNDLSSQQVATFIHYWGRVQNTPVPLE